MLFGHGSKISGYLVPALMWMVRQLQDSSVYGMLSVSLITWTGVYWVGDCIETTRDCDAWYTSKQVDFVLTHTFTSTSAATPGNTTGEFGRLLKKHGESR